MSKIKTWVWRHIFREGCNVCGVCYRRLNRFEVNFDPLKETVLWYCRECEVYIDKTIYVPYWPFGMIQKRMRRRVKNVWKGMR